MGLSNKARAGITARIELDHAAERQRELSSRRAFRFKTGTLLPFRS